MELEEVSCRLCGAREAAVVASGQDYEYATTEETFRFVRCARCGLLYLNPRPALSALPVIYPGDYYSFTDEDEGRGVVRWLRIRWEERKARDYARWLGPGRRRVLDVGCGRGRLLRMLRRVGPQWDLHGIDLDRMAVEAVRALGFRAAQASIEDYAPEGGFDLIIMQQVIEHVADPRAVLAKLTDMLVPGGVIVLETPNPAGWDYRLFKSGLWGGYHFPRHWTMFDRRALRRMVRECGLQVIDERCLASLSFWSWSVHHCFLAKFGPRRWLRFLRPPKSYLLAATLPLEVLQLALGLETSNQRMVARKPGHG